MLPKKRHNARNAKLQVDYTDLLNLANRSEFIEVQPVDPEPGWPPEKYTITFTCAGIRGVGESGEPKPSVFHQVSLYLSRDYPVKEPSLLWLTEIWHPNIDHKEPRHVCTNAVQTFFSSKPLSELVLSLAEMVQYRRYHAKLEPPFPLDQDAARWVREYAEPKGIVGPSKPFDSRPLLREYKIVRSSQPPSINNPGLYAVPDPPARRDQVEGPGADREPQLPGESGRIKLGSPKSDAEGPGRSGKITMGRPRHPS